MRVFIEKFDANCITDDYLSWLNDKQMMKFSRQSASIHSKSTCFEYLESFLGTVNEFWSLKDEAGKQIGTMTAYINSQNLTADIGILVGVGGRGIGSIAWGQAIKKLFEEKHIRKITAGTMSEHKRMISIFEKHGMKQEGYFREQEIINGEILDVVRYGLLRREWIFQSPSSQA